MDIKTKYNIGDKVFYIHNNQLCKGSVHDIHVLVFPDGEKYFHKLFNT
jgi:predicted metal-dependent hydrolase